MIDEEKIILAKLGQTIYFKVSRRDKSWLFKFNGQVCYEYYLSPNGPGYFIGNVWSKEEIFELLAHGKMQRLPTHLDALYFDQFVEDGQVEEFIRLACQLPNREE